MTRRMFGARRVGACTPQTVVSSCSLPYRAWLYHPHLGLLEVGCTAPAEEFSAGEVAATRDEPRRWFVGGAIKGLSANEVSGDAVLEGVNAAPARREPNPSVIKGYLDVTFFSSREEAEGFVARFTARDRRVQRLKEGSRRRAVTMRCRVWRRRLWRRVPDECEVRIQPAIERPEMWILFPTQPTRALPRGSIFEVTGPGPWPPGPGTRYPVAATLRAVGTDTTLGVELWPAGEGGRS